MRNQRSIPWRAVDVGFVLAVAHPGAEIIPESLSVAAPLNSQRPAWEQLWEQNRPKTCRLPSNTVCVSRRRTKQATYDLRLCNHSRRGSKFRPSPQWPPRVRVNELLNPAVYPPCTSLRRFCGFSPFCFFVESVS